jgi:hypothetical protein
MRDQEGHEVPFMVSAEAATDGGSTLSTNTGRTAVLVTDSPAVGVGVAHAAAMRRLIAMNAVVA